MDHYEYDAKVDMWSLGCILYEMLVGKTVFLGSTQAEVLSNVKVQDVVFPSNIKVSDQIIGLLQKVCSVYTVRCMCLMITTMRAAAAEENSVIAGLHRRAGSSLQYLERRVRPASGRRKWVGDGIPGRRGGKGRPVYPGGVPQPCCVYQSPSRDSHVACGGDTRERGEFSGQGRHGHGRGPR